MPRGILGIILNVDGSIKDIGLIASSPQERREAQNVLFILQDTLDRFESSAKEQIRSIGQTPVNVREI